MTTQLALPLERPAGTPALMVRAHRDRHVLRAVCDWSRHAGHWRSANGWTVKPAFANGREDGGWAAYAPDGVGEWWAHDPVTAMVRAEGGS